MDVYRDDKGGELIACEHCEGRFPLDQMHVADLEYGGEGVAMVGTSADFCDTCFEEWSEDFKPTAKAVAEVKGERRFQSMRDGE